MSAKFTRSKAYSMARIASTAVAIITAGMLASGCASTHEPNAQIAVARTVVTNASNADTNKYAPIELKSAKDKLAGAEQAIIAGNYALAQQLAEEAQVDARLAETKSQTAKAQSAAQDSQDATRVLSEELDRKAR